MTNICKICAGKYIYLLEYCIFEMKPITLLLNAYLCTSDLLQEFKGTKKPILKFEVTAILSNLNSDVLKS
jgi:hypothetical protein